MNDMISSAWGMYPKIKCKQFTFEKEVALKEIIGQNNNLIPFGNGRSYGDSALSEKIVSTRNNNKLIDFDIKAGIIHAESGVLLSEILLITFKRSSWLVVGSLIKLEKSLLDEMMILF